MDEVSLCAAMGRLLFRVVTMEEVNAVGQGENLRPSPGVCRLWCAKPVVSEIFTSLGQVIQPVALFI